MHGIMYLISYDVMSLKRRLIDLGISLLLLLLLNAADALPGAHSTKQNALEEPAEGILLLPPCILLLKNHFKAKPSYRPCIK